jgi:hypothetical protein
METASPQHPPSFDYSDPVLSLARVGRISHSAAIFQQKYGLQFIGSCISGQDIILLR